MRPTRKKRHTSWKGYVQRREPNSRSSSREPNQTGGWQYDINMNKEIEIEMRKYRADRGREMEREREKREKARESREATSGSTGRLGWAVGAALREVRLQAGAGEIELHIQDGDPCG